MSDKDTPIAPQEIPPNENGNEELAHGIIIASVEIDQLNHIFPIQSCHPSIDVSKDNRCLVIFNKNSDGFYGAPAEYEGPVETIYKTNKLKEYLFALLLMGVAFVLPLDGWFKIISVAVAIWYAVHRIVFTQMAEMENRLFFYRRNYVAQILSNHFKNCLLDSNYHRETATINRLNTVESSFSDLQERYMSLRELVPIEILRQHDEWFMSKNRPSNTKPH